MELIPQNTTPRHSLSTHTHTPHAAGACTPEQNIHIAFIGIYILFIGMSNIHCLLEFVPEQKRAGLPQEEEEEEEEERGLIARANISIQRQRVSGF